MLKRLDPPAGVAGLEVEGHAALGGHVTGDLGPPLVARSAGLVFELIDGGALVGDDLVQLGRKLGHAPVGIAFGQHLGPPLAQLLQEIDQPGDLLAVSGAHSRTQEAAQRVVEIATRQEVLGQTGQEVVRIEVDELLGAVPLGVVVAGAHALTYLRPR